jgi:hypothetical protein
MLILVTTKGDCLLRTSNVVHAGFDMLKDVIGREEKSFGFFDGGVELDPLFCHSMLVLYDAHVTSAVSLQLL